MPAKKPPLTTEQVEALTYLAGVSGADVWAFDQARIMRELEPLKLVHIVKAKNAPSDGAKAQPYFGVKISARGRRAIGMKTENRVACVAMPVTTFDDLGFKVGEYPSGLACAEAIGIGLHSGSISQSIYAGSSIMGVRCYFSSTAPERIRPQRSMVIVTDKAGRLVDFGRQGAVFARLGFGRGAPHAVNRDTPYLDKVFIKRISMAMAVTLREREQGKIAA